ncbi:MAG: MFS transporter [Candidatus Scalindua sp.]|nr:MFS transporter [Candidatus Scalindua sp.]
MDTKKNSIQKIKIRKTLRMSIFEGSFSGISASIFEYFIRPLALFLNASLFQIGILSSIPQLLISVTQLYLPDFLKKFKSRRNFVSLCALIQAFMVIPIILVHFVPKNLQIPLLISFYCLYAIIGSMIVPVWASLMSDIVPKRIKGLYFGRRAMVIGISSLVVVLFMGYLLQVSLQKVFWGFVVIFTFACVLRIISSFILMRHYDAPLNIKPEHHFSFFQFLKRSKTGNFGKYVFFVSAMSFSVFIASPYFSVYMLKRIHFGYIEYTIISVSPLLFGLLLKPVWGRIGDKFGNLFVIRVCSLVIALVPAAWLVSNNFYWLLLIQVPSGLAWSGFNLCTLNFIYDSAIPEKRVRCISYFNTMYTFSACAGAFLSGLLANYVPELWGERLLSIFAISAILRGITLLFFYNRVKEVKQVRPFKLEKEYFKEIIPVFRPNRGYIRPVSVDIHQDISCPAKTHNLKKGL